MLKVKTTGQSSLVDNTSGRNVLKTDKGMSSYVENELRLSHG